MKIYYIKCPNCGAGLAYEYDSTQLHCDYCGTTFHIDESLENEDRKEENIETSNERLKDEEIREEYIKASIDDTHRNTSKVLKLLLCALLIFIVIWFFNNHKEEEEETVTITPTPVVTPTPTPTPTPIEEENKYDSHMKGTYYTCGAVGNERLEADGTVANYPWSIPTYTKDRQFFEESSERILERTEVEIVSDEFVTYHAFEKEGYVLVKVKETGQEYYVNCNKLRNYKYWEKEDPMDKVKEGGFVVEYHDRSDYYPVTSNNEKYILPEGTLIYICGKTQKDYNIEPHELNYKTHPLYGLVQNPNGTFGPNRVHINLEDIDIVH